MSPSKSNMRYLAVVLLASLCLIEQASARICYKCDSDVDRDCLSFANQNKFAVRCTTNMRHMNATAQANSITQDDVATKVADNDCLSAVGISIQDGRPRVIRGCSLLLVRSSTYDIIFPAQYSLQVNNLVRCNSDYCNYRNY